MTTPTGPGYPGAPGGAPGGFAAPGPAMAAVPGTGTGDAKKPPAKKPPRSGKTQTRRFAIAGAVLALLFLLGLLAVLGGDGSNKSMYVVRAKQNLPAQQAITASMLEAVPVDPAEVNPNWVTASTAKDAMDIAKGTKTVEGADGENDSSWVIVGQRPVVSILAGQEIRREALATQLRSATGELNPNERLISVAVSAERAAGGVLRAGDYIDVVTIDTAGNAGVVAQSVEIVGVQAAPSALASVAQRQASETGREEAAEDLLPSDPLPGVYVLRVEANSSLAIAAAAEGELYLLYRGTDSANIESPPVNLSGSIGLDATGTFNPAG